jgi:ElaB/YqjD/DUF883 family membrane-anchored ribosome-binding protein
METNYETIEKSHSAIARERVMTDLQNLARDAEDLIKATAGDVSDRAKEARARLGVALERAKTTCENFQDQTVASAKAAAKKADGVIREHPYQAIGIAFGVGLLIGVLATRK